NSWPRPVRRPATWRRTSEREAMPVKRRLLAALVLAMLLSACGGPEISLEELRQQAEEGACVLSVDADVDAGRDTWMDFYEAVQAGEEAEVPWCTGTTGIPAGTAARTAAIRTVCRLRRGSIPWPQRGRRMRPF